MAIASTYEKDRISSRSAQSDSIPDAVAIASPDEKPKISAARKDRIHSSRSSGKDTKEEVEQDQDGADAEEIVTRGSISSSDLFFLSEGLLKFPLFLNVRIQALRSLLF